MASSEITMALPMNLVLQNARLATMVSGVEPYGLLADGAVAITDGQIAWAGKTGDLPAAYSQWAKRDLAGRLVTPALIDCHTHLVFGGNRAREFELRLQGASYEEISRSGGGIKSTVAATRDASDASLLAGALTRVDAMIAEGVTTIEIKSGYGLDVDTELRMLRIARQIGEQRPIRVRKTFLGAHAIPADYQNQSDQYLQEVCLPAMRQGHAEGLIDAVDGFCETIAFSTAQIERVFGQAKALGLPVKLHAEQLSNSGGASLAARYAALSADHLEWLDDDGVAAMADAGTVAVLLPGAFYFLRETRMPPIEAFRLAKVRMAIATDCNPGSSPLASMLLAINMACTFFRMTPEEALTGATRHAAAALGLNDCGVIKTGLRADLAVWDVEHPAELAYRIGFNPLHVRFFGSSL